MVEGKEVWQLFHDPVLPDCFYADTILKIVVDHTVGLFFTHRFLQYLIECNPRQNRFDKRFSLLPRFLPGFRYQSLQFILLPEKKIGTLFFSEFVTQIFFRKKASIRLTQV